MRQPLKYQIMLPLCGVVFMTVVLMSAVNAWFAANRTRERIEAQLQDICETLGSSTFPLTETVLQQMRGLSGAEFIVSHPDQAIVAMSREFEQADAGLSHPSTDMTDRISLDRRVFVDQQPYFHVALKLRRGSSPQPAILQILYPEASYRQALREAVIPPLALGGFALSVVVLLSTLLARHFTEPIRLLRDQVDRIARGEFVPLRVPRRDDELQDLTIAVNRMSAMLAEYERNVRRTERLRTLDQLGAGIAHQIRNSVTGCRIAVDLHQRRCARNEDESMQVAIHELKLMEEYLGRFLAMARPSNSSYAVFDLTETVDNLLPLVQPRAKHLDVRLQWHRPADRWSVFGSADAIGRVIVNLLLNALEAASQSCPDRTETPSNRRVEIQLEPHAADKICLRVFDSGPGPHTQVQDKLFEPLVTTKSDGVGLGLAVAREIVEQHGGEISWCRGDQLTCFSVHLPLRVDGIPGEGIPGEGFPGEGFPHG